MHRVAALVEAWHHQQRAGTVARVIGTDGLGPQHRDELLLVDADGRTGGSLLGGALSPELARATRALLDSDHAQQVLTLDIDGGDATAAGLTCGGTVHVLLQRLDTVPEPLWASFAAGRSVALVTPLDDEHAVVVVHPGGGLDGTLGSSGLDTMVQAEAEALLARPGAGVNRVRVGDLELVIEAWDPTPRVVIVGASDLSAAIERQAELIGWAAATVIHAAAATDAIGALDHGDAVLVIDHDPVRGHACARRRARRATSATSGRWGRAAPNSTVVSTSPMSACRSTRSSACTDRPASTSAPATRPRPPSRSSPR